MKRVFLDTNFIIDYFVRENHQGDSERLIRYGTEHELKFYISYLTVANFAYIMRKMPQEQLLKVILQLCSIFTVINNTEEQILRNLRFPFKDFEDGLQYQAALDAGCECIISRNQKDFINPEIPVLSATEFLNLI